MDHAFPRYAYPVSHQQPPPPPPYYAPPPPPLPVQQPQQQQQHHHVQQAAQEVVQQLSMHHHQSKKRHFWVLLVLALAALLTVSVVIWQQQLTIDRLRDSDRLRETQIKTLQERVARPPAVGVASKRDSTPLDLFESTDTNEDSSSSSSNNAPFQEYVYEFQMPSARQMAQEGGGTVRVPDERGTSLPNLDLVRLVSFDVCCRMDERTFSCARGADVGAASVRGMSASMQSDPDSGAQYLSVRVGQPSAYAGRRCVVRFAEK
jgi:hypothetical protein